MDNGLSNDPKDAAPLDIQREWFTFNYLEDRARKLQQDATFSNRQEQEAYCASELFPMVKARVEELLDEGEQVLNVEKDRSWAMANVKKVLDIGMAFRKLMEAIEASKSDDLSKEITAVYDLLGR